MATVFFGTKVVMGEAYLGKLRRAVTKISLSPHQVLRVKTLAADGYQALQVSFAPHFVREIPYLPDIKVGTTLNPLDFLQPGATLSIQGITKGKGFAGVVKRWGFAGGFKTHGQSDRHRAPGSIGQGTTPGRVHKGKKMPGRMGHQTHTVKNAVVVAVMDHAVWVTGPVPGHSGASLRLTVTGKQQPPPVQFVSGGLPLSSSPSASKDQDKTKDQS